MKVTRFPFVFALAVAFSLQARGSELCQGVIVDGAIDPALDANETTLICGSPPAEKLAEGWENIPKNQALFSLKGFLQSRGYLNPSFKNDGKTLRISPGELVRVAGFQLEGAPEGLDITKKRKVVGRLLTPKVLTEIEQWAKNRLTVLGYACAEVKGAADPATGNVVLKVKPGGIHHVKSVKSSSLSLRPSVFRRYDPFSLGDRYNSDLLAISADRAVTDGVAERTFFVPACSAVSDGVVEQQGVLGRQKIATFGISVNTEEIGVLQGSLEHVRIGELASSAKTDATASLRVQELSAYYNWRMSETLPRSALRPIVAVRHQNETPYDQFSERVHLAFATQFDVGGLGAGLLIGPQYELYQTIKGVGPASAHALQLAALVRVSSHSYEFNRTRLGSGYRFSLDSDWSNASILSTFGAFRGRAKGEVLINVGGFDPPAVVVSVKVGYSLTVPEGGAVNGAALPPSYRNFLGGSSDLRGYARLELPNRAGALSAATASLEVRPDLLGAALQPIAFVDAGLFGLNSSGVAGSVFWSPGAGVTWSSPIGNFRSTVAHGFNTGEPAARHHWQFYLSLGEQL